MCDDDEDVMWCDGCSRDRKLCDNDDNNNKEQQQQLKTDWKPAESAVNMHSHCDTVTFLSSP
jgi:hypothetical protein